MKILAIAIALLSVSAWAGVPISSTRVKHSTTSYPSTAWTTINSGMLRTANWVHAYNNSTSGTLTIAVGASGSESTAFILKPGVDMMIPMRVVTTARVSAKGTDGTVTTGDSGFDWFE